MMQSTIAHKYPSFRDGAIKGCKRWLDGKRLDDNAEGLWRIHDKLYDLTDFIDRHPGGSEWLDVTKGVDITEQFETHHISGTAEKILPKFYVREASLSRNYKITFDEDGFYRTVKRRVANKLELLDQSSVSLSHFYCDILLGSTLLLSIIAARDHSYLIATFASFTLMWLAVIAHNFIHQKDNWRMYIINLSLMSFHDWRGEIRTFNCHFPGALIAITDLQFSTRCLITSTRTHSTTWRSHNLRRTSHGYPGGNQQRESTPRGSFPR